VKIAFVNQPWNRIVPPVQAGSIAIIVDEVARRLKDGHEVTIYSKRDPDQAKKESYEGVRYRRFPILNDRRALKVIERFFPQPASSRPLFARSVYYLGYMIKVARDMRKHDFDVVHLHNFSQFAPIIRRFNPRTRIVLHMHCEWLTQLDRKMIDRRLDAVDSVITVCNYITRKVTARFPKMDGRCFTIHNGANLETFVPRDGNGPKKDRGKRLVFVGRVSPEKGIHVLLDAFPKVVEQVPGVHLEIVGPMGSAPTDFIVNLSDDPMVSKLSAFYDVDYEHLLKEKLTADIADHVTFTGNVEHGELLQHLWSADIFLHPSVWGEPFPLAVLEAMAAGLPAVASRAGGLVESIDDGKTGLLVEPDNPGALADALIKLLQDDELRESMAAAARVRAVGRYSWARVAGDFLDVYRKTMEASR
jgi:glycosyltransferase involved in cell wall biosynthesis